MLFRSLIGDACGCLTLLAGQGSHMAMAGGYVLARPARFIHIAQIMNAVEEETRMTRCLDGDVGCLGEQRCLTHGLWHALGGHIAAFLANVTLQEVLDGIPPEKLAEQPRGWKE